MSAERGGPAGPEASSRPAAPRPLGVGVIGFGYWGSKLARNFHDLPESRLTALADLSTERRQQALARYPDCRVLDDHRRLLAMPEIEAVAVATPPASHAALACEALAAGKHVLVEKPLALSLAEADRILAAAERTGRKLMVGHTFEHNPAVEKLRELVSSGELGRILYIHATRVNLGLFQPDINVLWDLAPHDLSILVELLGEMPLAVQAQGRAYVRPHIEDVAWLTLDFPGGVTAQVHVSWLDPCKIRRVTVVGDRQMVVYDDLEPLDKITIYDRGVELPPYTDSFGEFQLSYRYGDVRSPRLDWVEPLKRECADFLRSVREGCAPRSDGASGRRVVAILEAADRSLAAGGARIPLDAARQAPPSDVGP